MASSPFNIIRSSSSSSSSCKEMGTRITPGGGGGGRRLAAPMAAASTAVALVLLLSLAGAASAASGGGCSASGATFYCPNCGGMNVTDCMMCDGYLSTDVDHGICFDRTLFAPWNVDPDDPDGHYHYLWRDVTATFVWFFAAGIATACGVGGGGIYVPLGMILLLFAPKPSSGLSQASIFGASLGGLLLNLRSHHPNTRIRADPDAEEREDEKTYKRPLVDYDMALFLAPMEMAGAVLGVLIQRVLPNWLYLTLAAVILAFTAYKTYNKWWSTRKKEMEARREKSPGDGGAAAAGGTTENHQEQPPTVANTAASSSNCDEAVQEGPVSPDSAANANSVEVSLHTKHVLTTPTVGRVDWTAPSEIYRYSTSSLGGPESNGGDGGAAENAEEEEGGLEETKKSWVGKMSTSAKGDGDDGERIVVVPEGENEDPTENNDAEEEVEVEGAVPEQGTDKEAAAASDEEETALTPDDGDEVDAALQREREDKRIYWLERDARQYPKEKLFALVVLWIGLILLTFMKGGKGVDSIVGITCESPWYGVLIAIQFLWTFGFALIFGLRLVKHQEAKEACGYPFLENDVLWDRAKLRFYAFFTFVAGIVAGLIGIGGGMVLGPLMLVMGIHPRVSSATTGTMIVLTSSSVAVLFVTSGMVPWQYAVYFFFICFVGAYIGKRYIDGYVKRSGKASILIFLLATIIALAVLGCIYIVLTQLAAANWCIDGFHQFCVPSSKDDGEVACPVERFLLLLEDAASQHFA